MKLPTCYIVHYGGYSDRAKFQIKQFEKEGISPIWINEFDKPEYIDYFRYFKADIGEYQRRQHKFYTPRYPLKPEEVSLALKQLQTLSYIANSIFDYGILFEDDVILAEGFVEKFEQYTETLPADWDIAYIGQGAGKRIESEKLQPGIHWYKKEYPSDRCADSILFTKDAARKIAGNIIEHKICFPIDHEYSFWAEVLKLNVYWLEPPIVAQGSQAGLFKTFQDPHSQYLDKSLLIRSDIEELINAI